MSGGAGPVRSPVAVNTEPAIAFKVNCGCAWDAKGKRVAECPLARIRDVDHLEFLLSELAVVAANVRRAMVGALDPRAFPTRGPAGPTNPRPNVGGGRQV
jgi:hypothetical protein